MDGPRAPTLDGEADLGDPPRVGAMGRRDQAWLALIAAVFLAWHVPLMYRTVAGQDEDWYGVTGITTLRGGIPRIPYLPARDPDSVCYKADVAVFALPPLGFYLEAMVHLVLGLGIGQARMASALAGLASAYLVYDLTRVWFGDGRAGVLAATSLLFSRAFYFPATTARPDMAAVAFGLLAVRFSAWNRLDPGWRPAAASGLAAGLSLLTHPFGIVPATQVGVALLAAPGPIRARLGRAILYATVAGLVFALWIPLILRHPDLFRAQFGGNVLRRAGPGLGTTLLAPGPILAYQIQQFMEFVRPIQAALFALGLAWGALRARRYPGGGAYPYHAWAGILLLMLFEGRHATLGYYAYPVALASVGVGMLASEAATWLARRSGPRPAGADRIATAAVVVLLLVALAPGAGLRTLWANLRHLDDPAYDARAVARSVMADIPAHAPVAVDEAYVLDFYLAGRPVLDATIHPLTFDFRTEDFEYVVFSRIGLRSFKPRMDGLTLLESYGDPGDPFAPYAELYRRSPPRQDTASPPTGG